MARRWAVGAVAAPVLGLALAEAAVGKRKVEIGRGEVCGRPVLL